MTTPSAPAARARVRAETTLSRSKGCSISPPAPMRSRTPNTMSRGINGGGRFDSRLYMLGILSRASSSTSQKCSVVNSARRRPLRWMTVLTPAFVWEARVDADGRAVCEIIDLARRDAVALFEQLDTPQHLGTRLVGTRKDFQAAKLVVR